MFHCSYIPLYRPLVFRPFTTVSCQYIPTFAFITFFRSLPKSLVIINRPQGLCCPICAPPVTFQDLFQPSSTWSNFRPLYWGLINLRWDSSSCNFLDVVLDLPRSLSRLDPTFWFTYFPRSPSFSRDVTSKSVRSCEGAGRSVLAAIVGVDEEKSWCKHAEQGSQKVGMNPQSRIKMSNRHEKDFFCLSKLCQSQHRINWSEWSHGYKS
jgi:hypothetical protein